MKVRGYQPTCGAYESMEACRVCPALSGLHGLSSLHPLGRAFVSPGSLCITGSEVPAESSDSGALESLSCLLQAFQAISTSSTSGGHGGVSAGSRVVVR